MPMVARVFNRLKTVPLKKRYNQIHGHIESEADG
jgi:hypothetical protein